MKRLLFFIICCLIFYVPALGRFPDNEAKELIDEAIEKTGIGNDYFHIFEFVDYDDPHEIKYIDENFDDYKKIIPRVEKYSELVKSIDETNADEVGRQISQEMNFKKYIPYQFKTNIPSERIHEELNIKLDTVYDNLTVLVLRDLLMPLVQIDEFMKKDPLRDVSPLLLHLIKHSDELIIAPDKKFETIKDIEDFQQDNSTIAGEFYHNASLASMSKIYTLGFSLMRTYFEICRKIRKNPDLIEGEMRSVEFESSIGRIAIGGKDDNVFRGNYVFIIDFGGDDSYLFDELTHREAIGMPVRSIIDLEGDDVYSAGDHSLGGSVFGINLLMDYSGNDRYIAGDLSLGASVFGFGCLWDTAGDDVYISGKASQGFSAFGCGLLIDRQGEDKYTAGEFSQGSAGVRGFGVLSDNNGSDFYSGETMCQGASLGWKYVAAGGIGILIDRSGKDNYHAESGQGAAIWKGVGAIIDRKGKDKYSAQEFSQAAASGFSAAVMLDYLGNDRYIFNKGDIAKSKESAATYFIDFAGDDSYLSSDNRECDPFYSGISIFLDKVGNDEYSGFYNSRKCNNSFVYRPDIDIRIDAAGEDINILKGMNGIDVHNNFSFVSDLPSDPATHGDENIKIKGSLEELFSVAAGDNQQYAEAAREEIVAYGEKATEFLSVKWTSPDPVRRQAAVDIFIRIAIKNKSIAKLFIDSLKSRNILMALSSAEILCRINYPEAVPEFINLLGYGDWRLRAIGARGLAIGSDSAVTQYLMRRIGDSHPVVRANAAYSLGIVKPAGVIDSLENISEPLVLRSAFSGLTKNAPFKYEYINNILVNENPDNIKREFAALIAFCSFSKKDYKRFKKQYQKYEPEIREQILISLIKYNIVHNNNIINDLINVENDNNITDRIMKLLEIQKNLRNNR